jgi:ornithine carbamoyltransferase
MWKNVIHLLQNEHGNQVTKGVINGSQSIVFDFVENRLHAQKAVMALAMS